MNIYLINITCLFKIEFNIYNKIKKIEPILNIKVFEYY